MDEITRPRPPDEEKLEQVQVMLQWDCTLQGLRDLRSDVVAGLIKIQGIITSVSSRRNKATSVTLQCRNCRSYLPNLPVKAGLEGLMLPRRCQNSINAAGKGFESNFYKCVSQLDQQKSTFIFRDVKYLLTG